MTAKVLARLQCADELEEVLNVALAQEEIEH